MAEITKLHITHEWNEIALLYRTNAQSRSIEEAFIRNGIPYVLFGGTKFYERKEIKDLCRTFGSCSIQMTGLV